MLHAEKSEGVASGSLSSDASSAPGATSPMESSEDDNHQGGISAQGSGAEKEGPHDCAAGGDSATAGEAGGQERHEGHGDDKGESAGAGTSRLETGAELGPGRGVTHGDPRTKGDAEPDDEPGHVSDNEVKSDLRACAGG